MRILVASEGCKTDLNGVSIMTWLTVSELRRRGHEVLLITLADGDRSFCIGDNYYVSSYHSGLFPEWKRSHAKRKPLIQKLKQWKPDIIHVHTEGFTGGLARTLALKEQIPLVITSHTDYGKFVFGLMRKIIPFSLIQYFWGIYAYGCADVVIMPAEKALDFEQHFFISGRGRALLNHFFKMQPSFWRNPAVRIVPNGIELSLFQNGVSTAEKEQLLSRYRLQANNKILLTVSRLGKEKRIRDLISYMPGLLKADSGIHLVIVGNGPYKKNLMQYAKRMKVLGAIRFIGAVPNDQMARFYDIGSVFVSASDFEVNSISFLEAMASGLALVCRRDPCLKNVLKQGYNGYAFRNELEFDEYVMRLLRDKDLREKMGENSRNVVKNYSSQRYAENILKVYEQALS